MTNDDLRRYRDCARDLAEVADPFIGARLLDLARRYEDRMNGNPGGASQRSNGSSAMNLPLRRL